MHKLKISEAGFVREIFLIAFVLFISNAVEASDQLPLTQLDPIIVTASSYPTRLSKSPANITVIPRSQIAQQHSNRLSEVLQQVEGLYVDEMGGRGGISSVYLRGGDPNFTLVMIDGIAINDPMNQRGGSVDLSTLTPERIEQIEIIRGPLSALYGSEAVSGVINIITRQGEDTSRQHVRLAGGRFGYTREVLQAYGPSGPITYAVSLTHSRNDAMVKKDAFELANAGWHIRAPKVLPFDIQFTGQFTYSDLRAFPEGSGGPRLSILQDTEKRTTYELVAGLRASHSIGTNWEQLFSLNFFRRTQDGKSPGVLSASNTFQIPPNTFDTTYIRIQPRWHTTFRILPNISLTGGLQLISEIGTRTGTQQLTTIGAPSDVATNFRQTRHTAASFAEVSAEFFSDLRMTGGFRVDIPEGVSPKLSPRVGATYQITPSTRIRAGYGEGFKLPSMTSLADPIIGNADLKPETSRGWDIGIRQRLFENAITMEFTYFRNTFSRLIDLDPRLSPIGIFRLINLHTVRTHGFEFSTRFRPISELSIKGFMTYLNTEIVGRTESLRNRPKWSGGIVLTGHPYPALTIRTQVRVTGSRVDFQIPTQQTRVSGYVAANLAITYRPTPSWQLFGRVENLTDSEYEEFIGFPAPGLVARFGLEYTHQ